MTSAPKLLKCLILLTIPACHEPSAADPCGWESGGDVVSSSCPPPSYARLIAGIVTDTSGRAVSDAEIVIISQSLRPEGCVWYGPVKTVRTSSTGEYAERLGSAGSVGCLTLRVRPPEEAGLAEVSVDTAPVTHYDTRDPAFTVDTLIMNAVLKLAPDS